MKFALPALLLAIAASPSIVSAQPPEGGRRGGPGGPGHRGPGEPPHRLIDRIFDAADEDGDGSVTKEELLDAVRQLGPPRRPDGSRGPRRGDGARPDRPRRPGRDIDRGDRGRRPAMGRRGGLGRILEGPMADRLNLSDDQREQIEALQSNVKEQMQSILTDEQRQMMRGGRKPRGRDDQSSSSDDA